MNYKSLTPVQVTLPPVGDSAVESIALIDYRMNEKLAAVEQRIRELESLLSAASNERLRLMNKIGEVRGKLLEMESSKAVLEGYELCEVAPGWRVFKSEKHRGKTGDSLACPEWHHAGKVTTLQMIATGRRQIIYKCTSPSCGFLKTVEASP